MERELKQLTRAELVEILYAQQKENEALKAENAKLRALLDERELHISTAGSIAEAALQVNHVYETAQEAADQYLRSIRRLEKDLKERTADAEQEKAEILRSARQQAEALTREAEDRARRTVEEADRMVRTHWDEFREKEETLIRAHEALQRPVGGGLGPQEDAK